ncbi:hypothetical protein ACFL3D_05535 [Candidatus Omnitrophota bacterium]
MKHKDTVISRRSFLRVCALCICSFVFLGPFLQYRSSALTADDTEEESLTEARHYQRV